MRSDKEDPKRLRIYRNIFEAEFCLEIYRNFDERRGYFYVVIKRVSLIEFL